MADWTDGPEYAPRERPEAFEAPAAEPLAAAPRATLLPGAPDAAPAGYQAPDAVPLDRLVAAGPPTRDPARAFDVVSTPLTTAGAGASGGPAWTPTQPLALPERGPGPEPVAPSQPATQPAHAPVNPQAFPSAEGDRWHAPYAAPTPAPPPPPVTVGALAVGAGPALVGSLLTGGVLGLLGVTGGAIAGLFIAWAFSGRARYRRRQLSNLLSVTALVVTALSLYLTVEYYGTVVLGAWLEMWSGWSAAACWLLLPAVLIIVSGPLRRNEPPEAP